MTAQKTGRNYAGLQDVETGDGVSPTCRRGARHYINYSPGLVARMFSRRSEARWLSAPRRDVE